MPIEKTSENNAYDKSKIIFTRRTCDIVGAPCMLSMVLYNSCLLREEKTLKWKVSHVCNFVEYFANQNKTLRQNCANIF